MNGRASEPNATLCELVSKNDMTELSDLLMSLESSIRAAQAALLSHDFQKLDHLTQAQQQIARILQSMAHPQIAKLRCSVPIAERVLQLGRVQLALLGRGQGYLRLVSNLLAGAASDYSTVAHREQISEALRGERV